MSPTSFAAHGHVKPHMYIDKEMSFNILVLYLLVKGTVCKNKRCLVQKLSSCTYVFVLVDDNDEDREDVEIINGCILLTLRAFCRL